LTLPATIPVKYTEEDAEFLSVRPVVRQSFNRHELLDMILSITGKDPPRVQKVLHAGTVVFHFFRYRWDGFLAGDEELAAALAEFPDADPSRLFSAERCRAVLLDTGSQTPPEWKREEASRRRWLRGRSMWQALLELASAPPPAYVNYSYERKGDLYAVPLDEPAREKIAAAAQRLLPAPLRGPAAALPKAQRLLFVCPRAER